MTKNVKPSSSPERADATPTTGSALAQRWTKFWRTAFCPYRRLLVKIVPHSGESVYKLELSHRHLTLAGITALLLVAFLLWGHVADVRAAEARARTLAKMEAQQRQQLTVFSKETRLLWQKVGKLQHDDEEMRRYAKVIAPASSSHTRKAGKQAPTAKTAAHLHNQFGMTSPSTWRRVLAWFKGLPAQSELGFAAEAAELSSLSDAVDSTGEQTTALETRIRSAAEHKIAAELARERYLAAIPSIWPTLGYISSGFGYRSYPDSEFHSGLDIVNDYGAPIYATATGVVVEAGWYYGYGLRVIIDHGNGLQTWYAHASQLFVSVGQTVKKGQEIATVGATGFATGPHCHYQIELWGRPIDPTPYLNGSVKSVVSSSSRSSPSSANVATDN